MWLHVLIQIKRIHESKTLNLTAGQAIPSSICIYMSHCFGTRLDSIHEPFREESRMAIEMNETLPQPLTDLIMPQKCRNMSIKMSVTEWPHSINCSNSFQADGYEVYANHEPHIGRLKFFSVVTQLPLWHQSVAQLMTASQHFVSSFRRLPQISFK